MPYNVINIVSSYYQPLIYYFFKFDLSSISSMPSNFYESCNQLFLFQMFFLLMDIKTPQNLSCDEASTSIIFLVLSRKVLRSSFYSNFVLRPRLIISGASSNLVLGLKLCIFSPRVFCLTLFIFIIICFAFSVS